MAANDEIWRPEYDGPPSVAIAASLDAVRPRGTVSVREHRRRGAVGDRIVVRSTPQADGSFEVAAYGDGA